MKEVKDNKLLYTNRALAQIKKEMWEEAEKDCTDVLEIAECFEEGFEKSKDTCFKAFQRRAKARQGLRD